MAMDLGGGGRVIKPRSGGGANPHDGGLYNRVASAKAGFNHQLGVQQALRAAQAMYGGGPGGGGGGGGGGYRGGGGGGGGGDPYARARAEEEARRAKQRALVEQLYKTQVGQLNTGRNEARGALPGYLTQANKRIDTINHQNVQAGRTARGQINRDQGVAAQAIQSAMGGLGGDLQGQGVDIQALLGAGQMYQADTQSAQAAGQGFNSRLDALMRLAYGDNRSANAQINQSAQGQLSASYQNLLGQLQQQRTAALMGLA